MADYLDSLINFTNKLNPIQNKLLKKLDEINKNGSKDLLETPFIKKVSVWSTKEMAKTMAYYSNDFIKKMSPEQKEEYDKNQIEKQQIIDKMSFEDDINEMLIKAEKELRR